MDRRRVLVTGAAGFVARILRSHWESDRYALRLADVREVPGAGDAETVQLDVGDLGAFRGACDGVDTVVHLAADPRMSADFYETLLDRNIVGAYNAFHAAHLAGCRRVVFASSVNAVSGYGGRRSISAAEPVYPINVYGATKCWGEALGRAYSHENKLSAVCVRLGSPRFRQDGNWSADRPSLGISPRDTAQLFARCIDVEDLSFAIVNGTSRHRRSFLDVEETVRILGYNPQDGTAYPKTPSS